MLMEYESVTQQVRTSCKTVSEQAVCVNINHNYLMTYASSLPARLQETPSLDSVGYYIGHGVDTLAFVITMDAINFGSGYFPYLRKQKGLSGCRSITHCLKDYFSKHGPLSAKDLSTISSEDCFRLFRQDPENGIIYELMELFARALNELGQFLTDHFNGSFEQLMKDAAHSAVKLASILIQMPCFQDTARYHDMTVCFYKRAQLTAADLFSAFDGKEFGYFHDIKDLTMFADNLVPHVLRMDGVLIYEKSLIEHIESGALIEPGSLEEIEIRACALHAVELITNELKRQNKTATSADIDYLLWTRGQKPYYKAVPRHRARTIFY